MPETRKNAMQRFLVNLMEKPQALKKLKADPAKFISKSALSSTHKKILLSSDVKMIKDAVAKSVTDLNFYPQIGAGAGYIHIGGDKPIRVKGFKASPEFGFHIVFGAAQPQVKVSLRPKVSEKMMTTEKGPVVLETFAIHIGSDKNNV